MPKPKRKQRKNRILAELLLIIATVPIWRGVWILMDYFSGGNKLADALMSIVLGIVLAWLAFEYYFKRL